MKEAADALFKDKKVEEALQAYQQCLGFDELDAHYRSLCLQSIAVCQEELDDIKGAIQTMHQVVKIDGSYEIYIYRCKINKIIGDKAEAKWNLDKANTYLGRK